MTFGSSLSGLQAAEKQLQVTSNNVANAQTTGFKRSIMQLASVTSSSLMGASHNVIGSGVSMSGLSPDFSQGNFESSASSLDLAINGLGFFVLKDPTGMQTYTRSGSFQVNNIGLVENSNGSTLVGYVADAKGNITGAQGVLSVDLPILAPVASTTVTAGLNFDPSKTPPITPFVPGFTPINPPSPDSYTAASEVTIYDTLGDAHIMTSYFVKAPVLNTWYVHIGIDGIDVTPTVPTPPTGVGGVAATSSNPVAYPLGAKPEPFTLVFNNTGAFIKNNSATPPMYYGDIPPRSAQRIATAGTLANIGPLDFSINGSPITLGLPVDTFSYSDNNASALTIASAINASSALNLVTAVPNITTYNLGAPVLFGGNFNLAAGNLVINGIDMAGAYASGAALVAAINTLPSPIPNVRASMNGGNFVLENIPGAANGMNLTVETNGTSAGQTFGGFNLLGGVLKNVATGTVTLIPGNGAAVPSSIDVGVVTLGTGVLSANALLVNGVDVCTGGSPYASIAAMAANINAVVAAAPASSPIVNIVATIVAGELIITDVMGSDISVSSVGNVANTLTFSKLNTVTGGAMPVQKGNLSNESPIVLGGNLAANAGFTTGPKYGVVQVNSDPMKVSFNPNSGAVNPQSITIDYTTSTQYKANYAQLTLKQDGYTTGRLTDLSIDKLGVINANYDNNATRTLGQIALARFANQQSLTDIGGTAYQANAESGLALINTPGSSSLGSIQSNNLESSNVDLTNELVALIQAQSAFGANAQTLRTEDAITQTIINLR